MAYGNEFYLGDGLYASFDGFQIRLRAPRERGDDEIYLDPYTWQALVEWRGRAIAERVDEATSIDGLVDSRPES